MKLMKRRTGGWIEDTMIGTNIMALKVQGLSEDNCWSVCVDGCVNDCTIECSCPPSASFATYYSLSDAAVQKRHDWLVSSIC